MSAKQLGEDQMKVLETVKSYYGEVRRWPAGGSDGPGGGTACRKQCLPSGWLRHRQALRSRGRPLCLAACCASQPVVPGSLRQPRHFKRRSACPRLLAQVLSSTGDLKTSACCTAARPPHFLFRQALSKVPGESMSKYYGCGSPLPMGIEGLRWVGGELAAPLQLQQLATVGEAGSGWPRPGAWRLPAAACHCWGADCCCFSCKPLSSVALIGWPQLYRCPARQYSCNY